jgi:hypothetical protein
MTNQSEDNDFVEGSEFEEDLEEELDYEIEEEATPDDKKDLVWALTAPLDEMTLEQQMAALQRIRELRKVRMAPAKKKSELDQILSQLTPERASSLLKQLADIEATATAKSLLVEEKKDQK